MPLAAREELNAWRLCMDGSCWLRGVKFGFCTVSYVGVLCEVY